MGTLSESEPIKEADELQRRRRYAGYETSEHKVTDRSMRVLESSQQNVAGDDETAAFGEESKT